MRTERPAANRPAKMSANRDSRLAADDACIKVYTRCSCTFSDLQDAAVSVWCPCVSLDRPGSSRVPRVRDNRLAVPIPFHSSRITGKRTDRRRSEGKAWEFCAECNRCIAESWYAGALHVHCKYVCIRNCSARPAATARNVAKTKRGRGIVGVERSEPRWKERSCRDPVT